MYKVGFYGGKFRIVHSGHLYCLLQAASMVDELHVFVLHDEVNDWSLATDKLAYISAEQRVRWLRTLSRHLPNVTVHRALYHADTMLMTDWYNGSVAVQSRLTQPITHVFSSEPAYTPYFDMLYPNATHIVIDAPRQFYPVSATAIFNDGVYKHWDMIPEPVRRHFVKKVAILGVESTGKSTMAINLARLFNTNYVAEYGRTYLEALGSYDTLEDDFLKIAYTHKHLEEQALENANKVVFYDTEAITTQLFMRRYHHRESEVLSQMVAAQRYDLYLLLANTVEWVDDGTREYLADHSHLNAFIEAQLESISANVYRITSTDHAQRMRAAMVAVQKLIAR